MRVNPNFRFRRYRSIWSRRKIASPTFGLVLIFLLIALWANSLNASPLESRQTGRTSQQAGDAVASTAIVSGELSVHYLDVGKADCILIRQGDDAMLIDAGNNDDARLIKTYLDAQNIRKLAIVIGTHPHEDHIGSLDKVIENYAVGQLILPAVVNSSDSYTDLIEAIAGKSLDIITPEPGQTFTLGQATVLILGPVIQNPEDLNDASVVCKVTFGGTSFLFEGDASQTAEAAMIENGYDLQATVLKIGHHGSAAATGKALLNAVMPKFAIVSSNQEENAGLAAESTLKRLDSAGITVFRTDRDGTVIARSDGQNVIFKFQS